MKRAIVCALCLLAGPSAKAAEPQKQLLAADLYLRDAVANAKAIWAETAMAHDGVDKRLWKESASNIAADLGRARRHWDVAELDLALRANIALQASLSLEDHATVRRQVEGVLAHLIKARDHLSAQEQAAGLLPLERVTPPERQPVRGQERVPLDEDWPTRPNPPPRSNNSAPVPEQPGDVTEPPPEP